MISKQKLIFKIISLELDAKTRNFSTVMICTISSVI